MTSAVIIIIVAIYTAAVLQRTEPNVKPVFITAHLQFITAHLGNDSYPQRVVPHSYVHVLTVVVMEGSSVEHFHYS